MTEPIVLAAIVSLMLVVGLVLSINEGVRSGDWGGVGFLVATGLVLAATALVTITVAAIAAG